MEQNEIQEPHYEVVESFTNHLGETVVEKTKFLKEDLPDARKEAIDYSIFQLNRFNDFGNTDWEEGDPVYPNWWWAFNSTVIYHLSINLVDKYKSVTIFDAKGDNEEIDEDEIQKLENLSVEAEVLLNS